MTSRYFCSKKILYYTNEKHYIFKESYLSSVLIEDAHHTVNFKAKITVAANKLGVIVYKNVVN